MSLDCTVFWGWGKLYIGLFVITFSSVQNLNVWTRRFVIGWSRFDFK